MEYIIIEVFTQSSTFRNPEFQNFHKSLKLPPPTTIIGFSGAAMGLSPKAAQDFFEGSGILMGVYGRSEGIATDLWKYSDLKKKSVIRREILFNNRYTLVFAGEDGDKIGELREGFSNPCYALTLGSSDSLAKVRIVDEKVEFTESRTLEYCLVEGNVIKEVLDNVSNSIEFSIYNTSDPIYYDLPTRFSYEADYGMRIVNRRRTFSFVGHEMRLNIEKRGIRLGDVFIPLFEL